MFKKAIEIMGEFKSENVRRGIQFFLSHTHDSSAPSSNHKGMSPEPRTPRKISEILKSDITLLATYDFNSRMYFGARLSNGHGRVFFDTTWAGVDAFIKSRKTLRQLLSESTDVWVDTNPEESTANRITIGDQIEFTDSLYKDLPTRFRINIL